jgi:hypothetical protein
MLQVSDLAHPEEGFNMLEGNSPPETGEVSAASIKRRETTLAPQTGWSVGRDLCVQHNDTHRLGSCGIRILRFENRALFNNLEAVLEAIKDAVTETSCLTDHRVCGANVASRFFLMPQPPLLYQEGSSLTMRMHQSSNGPFSPRSFSEHCVHKPAQKPVFRSASAPSLLDGCHLYEVRLPRHVQRSAAGDDEVLPRFDKSGAAGGVDRVVDHVIHGGG